MSLRPHQISPNQNVTGNIASGGDIEFYRFTATGGAAYQISTALGSLSDSVVLVYACQGAVVDAGVCTELAFNDDAPSSTEGSHTLASCSCGYGLTPCFCTLTPCFCTLTPCFCTSCPD